MSARKYSTRIRIPEPMEVRLTETEEQLCTLLDECTHRLKEDQGVHTACRIAGGWVRDKLLGSDSNDIDVALEDMMGVPFAESFVSHCAKKKLATKQVARIESNPDQSKHLETARTTILGIELDFVNLRSEEYTANSRIPTQVAFGTPLQDALRRDITINALFYNVHTREVEDHTEKGLEDLRTGTIRTPLAPRETFLDDPLRVIRCVRFASRFGFDLVLELANAARDPEIQEALASKISRERVGEELDKMMKGRDPLGAIALIHDLSLYSSIFDVPTSSPIKLSAPLASENTALAAALILHSLLRDDSSALSQPSAIQLAPVHPLLLSGLSADSTTRQRLFLACALTPYRGVTCLDAKQKEHAGVSAALREALKLGVQNHYSDGIPALFSASDLLHGPVLGEWGERHVESERVRTGLLLREKAVHNPITGSMWATSLLFSLVQHLVPLYDVANDRIDEEAAGLLIRAYNTFTSRVDELGLQSMVEARPILDGRDIVRVLGASSPGAWVGPVLSRVIEWQLDHPAGSKEECETWLLSEHAAGRVSTQASIPAGKRKENSAAGATKKVKKA
ncbi:hypothetical protein CERSUDRAFT_79137 [Gelatoporia subvermispora B]|uniref:Poly A polymerase head domain-containing protein n=1 Tax=Ceriporiopsis subvermispora (strain B) TaxID=914234 RepID=M2RRL5_CERS8|nr:hypothetical protein CERSUDRAFT_79137 [Gelatoporia subvermispora B]